MTDVLCFAAHPDDVEFGMGGTYLALCKESQVHHVILTRGEAGTHGDPQTREKEAHDAARYAGASVEFLDFRDNFVEVSVQNALRLASVLRKHKPRLVFAPYHTNNAPHTDGKSHPDHLALGRLVLMACRFAKFKNAALEGEAHEVHRLIYYMVPAYKQPSFVVEIQDADALLALFACHESQCQLHNSSIVHRLMLEREWLGKQHKLRLAEGFLMDAPLQVDVMQLLKS